MALKRELAAAIAIPIILAILFFLPPIAFNLLVAVVVLAATWEFYRIAERTGHLVSKTVGIAGSAAILLWLGEIGARDLYVADLYVPSVYLLFGGVLVLFFLASVAPILSGLSPETALASAGSTVFGVGLIALPATAFCYLRSMGGPRSVLFLFLLVWGCDSFAYYGGRLFGRHKLAPAVSPNKTVEGSIAGLFGATLIGALAGSFWVLPELGTMRGAVAAALASTAGQLGDLIESLWKRGAGVKDSGVFLPGHGGFYDRIDSLLFAAPVLAAFVAGMGSR